jgi:hypothetical protein
MMERGKSMITLILLAFIIIKMVSLSDLNKEGGKQCHFWLCLDGKDGRATW